VWRVKTFKTSEALNKWVIRHGSKVQYNLIFLNNGFGVEWRPLRKM
jgi:hypothetical protein